MKLSREHKILLAVVGAGAMALGVDRVVIGTGETQPQDAAAATDQYAVAPSENDGAAPSSGSAAPAITPPAVTGPSIAQRLRDARDRHGDLAASPRDAFIAPADWRDTDAVASDAPPAPPRDERITRYLAQHKLVAVMNDIAIVNGQPYRVGDRIGDALLVSVDRTKAVLRMDDRSFEMPMEGLDP